MNLKAEGWKFFASTHRFQIVPVFVRGNQTYEPMRWFGHPFCSTDAYYARESMRGTLEYHICWMPSLTEKFTDDGIPYPMPPEAKAFWAQFGYEIPDSMIEVATEATA